MFQYPLDWKKFRALVDAGQVNEFDRAARLMEKRRPREAVALFVKLAVNAKRQGSMLQAANLRGLAALALLESGDQPEALEQARQAMGFYNDLALTKRAQEFETAFCERLRALGNVDAASEFERAAGRMASQPIDASVAVHRGRLPVCCPQCGAPVRSDEVKWIDIESAICTYCAATIRTDG